MFVGRSSGLRLAWAALLGALPAFLGACGLLIGLEDHQAFPGADAGDDVNETPDAPPDAPSDVASDALPDAEGPDGCAGMICGGVCLDTTSDVKNCGPCGNACAAGVACVTGACGDHIDQLSAGEDHGCALLHDGSVWCWGSNATGQLGPTGPDGITICKVSNAVCQPKPTKVAGLNGLVMVQVSAGVGSTCAVDSLGGVWCWGANESGQLGRASPVGGPVAYDPVPAPVVGLPRAAQVTVGHQFACARTVDDSSVLCWGSNLVGAIGNGGAAVTNVAPTAAVLPPGILDVAAGLDDHACALDIAHQVYCWGSNGSGELGHPSGDDKTFCGVVKCQSLPSPILGFAATGKRVHAGAAVSCVETANGVACWGRNGSGQITAPPDTVVEHSTPTVVAFGKGAHIESVDVRGTATCVLAGINDFSCIGDNSWGELGRATLSGAACANGTTCDPVAVQSLLSGLVAPVQIATGTSWAMILLGNNTILAWGNNRDGRLGHDYLASGQGMDLTGCGPSKLDTCNPTPSLVPQPGVPALP